MANVERIDFNYRLPSGNLIKKAKWQGPIEVVDKLADELVLEYKNPQYRSWYCGVIYDFGPSKVNEWRIRAKDGKTPAKLFSKYVKDSKTFKGSRNDSNG